MRHWVLLAAGATAVAARAGAVEIRPSALAELPPAQVVILGEVHDNSRHHENQAIAVAGLRPAALVFEMLTPEKAALVTPELVRSERELSAALDWDASGWPDFGMYHPIFLAAPDARIWGAGIPREAARAAVRTGAARAFGPEAARYGLALPLDPADLTARREEQRMAHCNRLPPELLDGMVEVQRLRDAALARAVVEAVEETGGPVAVITGTGHARRDVGVPAVLARAAPGLRVLSIGQFEEPPTGEVPFDLWLVTAPVERGDPCAALGG